MSKSNKKGGKRITKKELIEMMVELFQSRSEDNLPLKEIYRTLHLDTHPAKMLCMDVLEEMLLDDFIVEKPKYFYKLNVPTQLMEGVFHRKANGKNTFVPNEGGEPILVAERNSMNAMDGDIVKASMMARRRNHMREAEVIEIVKRSDKQFVGTLQVSKNYAYLLTEDRTLANDIFIPIRDLKKGKTGDKAVVKIVEWPMNSKNPVGKVIDILGQTGENNTEMHAILAEFGLPYSYPKQVEDAAEMIDAGITKQEIERREDCRETMTFTIDPYDAKDFDDAISIKVLKGEMGADDALYEVGVHIADVSHYVKEGNAIDKEAVKRATSVYLVDRTIPMLPERLCNFICSLRPDEEKLTFSVIFKMTPKAEVKDYRIVHTVIKSDRRFTYEEVQKVLEDHHEASEEDYQRPGDKAKPTDPSYRPAEDFCNELIVLNRLAKQLRAKRFETGAVDFDREEVKFQIDETGKPLGVYFKCAKDANKLVEEFMLLANRSVAESIGKAVNPKAKKNKKAEHGDLPEMKGTKTFVYRVHDLPDQNKLMNLSDFVSKFGHKLKTNGNMKEVSKNINKMLADCKGKKEQNMVEMITLRAMMKARYSTLNIGHYGLAFEYYTHFTSPIRRYPDLMVHRLLTRYAEGGRSALKEKYEDLCDHSSEMEQLAAQAERASIKYKQVEYMRDHMGEEFDGIISGVTESGIYVEVNENKCEGMVPLRDLDDDYYEFDEKNYCLRGRRHHNVYALGDPIRIKVARANLERKLLDFVLADSEKPVKPIEEESYKPASYKEFKKPKKASAGKSGRSSKRRK